MSSIHRIQDGSAIISADINGFALHMAGPTAALPAAGQSGYAVGCRFLNTTNGALYINVGTATSCSFLITYSEGTASPTASAAGYAIGSRYLNTTTGILYTNQGTATVATWVSQEISTLGYIPLPLQNFRAIASNDIPNTAATPSGGLLTLNTSPLFKRKNTTTDEALMIQWAAGNAVEVTTSFLIPPDMDVAAASVLNLFGQMGGAADTPVITSKIFPGIGGANAGGASAAFAATLGNKTTAIAAAAFTVYPSIGSVSLTPGTHATDALNLYGAWLTYTKKLLTA